MQDLVDRAISVRNQFNRELKSTVEYLKFMFELKRRRTLKEDKEALFKHFSGGEERKLYQLEMLKDYGRIDFEGKDRNFEKLVKPDIVV